MEEEKAIVRLEVLPPMFIYKGSAHLMSWHAGVEVKKQHPLLGPQRGGQAES